VDWPYEIAERDHEIQNPTSAEKIRLLGEYLRLDRESRVLDVACGKAGPAVILATAFGCSITGIELRAGFADEGRAPVSAAGLESLVEIYTADARGCRTARTMKGTSTSLAQAIASPRRASRLPRSSPPTRTTGTATKVSTGARSRSGSQRLPSSSRRSARDTRTFDAIPRWKALAPRLGDPRRTQELTRSRIKLPG
jgi:hypothetical protein